jgi:ubiquinone/menaquinone biosynthesis C-methylase UbiE
MYGSRGWSSRAERECADCSIRLEFSQPHLLLMTNRAEVVHSDNYVEYCRDTARRIRDPHDLALRGRDKHAITKLIHERIVDAVKLHSGDDVVDIGCGDGTLLRMAERAGASTVLGLIATDEEVMVLRRFGLNVRQALTDQLPVPDESASVVVCNNVLLVVPRDRIRASLREIYRIARPGARIFLGEIPFVETNDPSPKLTSRREMLSYLYREHGLRTWFGMLRRMACCQLTGKPVVIRSGTAVSFYASAPEFIELVRDAGLRLVRYWQHDQPNTRNNYLFTK